MEREMNKFQGIVDLLQQDKARLEEDLKMEKTQSEK